MWPQLEIGERTPVALRGIQENYSELTGSLFQDNVLCPKTSLIEGITSPSINQQLPIKRTLIRFRKQPFKPSLTPQKNDVSHGLTPVDTAVI